jgi:hypothetical protein
MEIKHTPGPWTAERSKKGYSMHINAEQWLAFAKVYIRMAGDHKDVKEGLANVNLILAAPDLLKALEDILPLIIPKLLQFGMLDSEAKENLYKCIEQAYKAIKKATE